MNARYRAALWLGKSEKKPIDNPANDDSQFRADPDEGSPKKIISDKLKKKGQKMSRLTKAINLAKNVNESRGKALKKAEPTDMDLFKGCHDAMDHHAKHAKAAENQGDHESAKQHMFMMMRHALEDSRKGKTASGMRYKLQRALDFHRSNADDDIGWDRDSGDPASKHFKNGGKFKPHKDDKFKEDYEDGDGPKVKK